ncbi:hypothetical protein [Cyanobium sp. Morenito 9A2]|uniref:hypothetical protein n=1 Tax=Cyanobium sp. Morenito 9A2 TaxID=2823718 RepID=UPI0020CBEF9F|nr:hypothetical protein [Cyanobium sp. Morenito 9A2]MCP9850863.1 hypothetical protein [Cyanobium sp. Morenito 9A2]
MRRLLALTAGLALFTAPPLLAQSDFPFNLQRATNVARMRAEKLNGGLGVYRPDRCMYDRKAGNCIIDANDQGILFRFLGGPPGWQQLNLPPTTESEIRISPDGREVLSVIYNGKPR